MTAFWASGRARLAIIMGGIVAVIALVALGAVLATRDDSGSAGAAPPARSESPAPSGPSASDLPASVLTCPDRYLTTGNRLWVPTNPSGFDAQARLAPATVPTAAVVCAYLHQDKGALTGSRTLTGDLTAIATQFDGAPNLAVALMQPCPLYYREVDDDDFLIGLHYPAALVWVASPRDHCGYSGNGVFVSASNFGEVANTWYESGRAS